MFFHSTSCNAFVFGVQAFWSPKTSSKTILFTNNSPAITASSFLQLPDNSPAITTSSFLQLPNDSTVKQRLDPNDDNPAITTSSFLQLFQVPMNVTSTSTVTCATMTATMTLFSTTRSATSKEPQFQLDKCKATQAQHKTTSLMHPILLTNRVVNSLPAMGARERPLYN